MSHANSLASNSSHSRPPLSKASTQLQLINEKGSVAVRQVSSEAPGHIRVSGQWIPDYTLTATTDTTYLKVRRNTYMVAVKATKMESSSNYPDWKEEELDEVLVKITENDDDFCLRNSRQCIRSPDTSWSGAWPGPGPGTKGATPTPGSRRDSVWSTISIIKSKLGGSVLCSC